MEQQSCFLAIFHWKERGVYAQEMRIKPIERVPGTYSGELE